jgi:23S rRNA (guanosine2251-2'-O)-methyltransferase
MEELNRLTVEEFQETNKTPVVLILDDVRSALNVGSAFRTADAFAIQKIILCGITAQPPHRDILKTALGSTESVDWSYQLDIATAIENLKASGYEIISVEQVEGSTMLNEIKITKEKKYALIFGNEVEGVSEQAIKLSDWVLEIPQFGTKHSLNIAVTLGIVSWEFAKKLRN